MTVSQKLRNMPPPYDVTDPPIGVRINLGTVAAALKVSTSDMADASGMSRTSAFKLLSNDWPVRMPDGERERVRQAIGQRLADAGATPEQLHTLWHAHGTACNHSANAARGLDGYGRPLDRHTAKDQPTEDHDMLLPKQTLEPQARRHFRLTTNPFDGEVTRDEQMFDGDEIRYVRETAWQCCITSGFAAIVGESGAGKTTIQADLEERIAQASEPITVIKPSVLGMGQNERQGSQLRSADILHAIISTLAPLRTMPQTEQARKVAAHKLLTASAQMGNHHLLVIEEAHSMPDAALKHLKRLHELRNGRRPLLGILLLAQPELKKRLDEGLKDGSLREVAQRCEVVQLLPLDGDLRAYLQCRAGAAGVALDSLIDASGVEALRERLTVRKQGQKPYSICYPLAVHNLLTKALNRAADIGVPVVNGDLVLKI